MDLIKFLLEHEHLGNVKEKRKILSVLYSVSEEIQQISQKS